MRAAFIDSSAFFALASSRDTNHAAATTIARRLHAERWRLFTSNFVRAEAHALILNRAGHGAADTFLAELREAGPTTLLHVSAAIEEAAIALISRFRDKDFTLTDATSFVLMDEHRIRYAFTFDDDFRRYGLTIL
ncbi:MAG TPA: PIN domain-containing protein [Chloroflexota bacterium]|nr:PIN domain-containing protein [Chloroflexota bacterium]